MVYKILVINDTSKNLSLKLLLSIKKFILLLPSLVFLFSVKFTSVRPNTIPSIFKQGYSPPRVFISFLVLLSIFSICHAPYQTLAAAYILITKNIFPELNFDCSTAFICRKYSFVFFLLFVSGISFICAMPVYFNPFFPILAL